MTTTVLLYLFDYGFFILQSAAELLGCVPDVACFAKLMTGGIIPLAVTLTTESVFEAFKGDSKVFNSKVRSNKSFLIFFFF